jgi:hypothetical protein
MTEQNVLTLQVALPILLLPAPTGPRVLTFGGYKCTQIMKHILCIIFRM